MILYQDKIINTIEGMSFDTFPHSCIFVGKSGSGKTSIIEYAAGRLKQEVPILDFITITDYNIINADWVMEQYSLSHPVVYHLKADDVSIKYQNTLLKLLEEPPINVFLIFETNNRSTLIDTVLNRCRIFELSIYTSEQLSQFAPNNVDVSICETPGDVLMLTSINQDDIIILADKILDNIAISNSILGISNKFVEFNKNAVNERITLSIDLFLKIMLRRITDRIKQGQSIFDAYTITNKLINDFTQPHCNKQRLFDNYLYNLKEVMR